jgi:DNA-binding Xre family transcriptional regulator
MGAKSAEDLEAEARVRAHLRQQMDERSIHQTELAHRIGADDGNITRILGGERGIGLGLVLRICRALKITPTRLLEEDPPEKFFDSTDPRTVKRRG